MNSFCKKSWIVSSCLVVCCAVMLPGTVSGQESELETLKRQLKEMQDQMRTMAERIELMEQEKEAEQAAPSQSAQSAAQSFPGALNPAISVIGNFVGRADTQRVFNDSGDRIDNKMNLREAEIDMRVPIDPYADGVLIASLESESPGKFTADVEEGYVNVKKLPFIESPLGMKFQVGRFRPAFGKFNTLHTHDLPTTMRSLVTQEFLGMDGFISQGVSTDFFVPTPWDENSSINARVQVLTGGGIAVVPGSNKRLAY